jgi:hypothetical protein
MKNIFLVLLSLAFFSCTYHSQSKAPVTPVTYNTAQYRGEASVGKLRCLALMPVEIKSYKGKYISLKEQEATAQSYGDACGNFLINEKGYEIVVVRDIDGKWQNDLIEKSGYDNIQDLYKKWHKKSGEKHAVSDIHKIGQALNVDGVLVIQIKERKPWGITQALLNIALMNIPLFYKIGSPTIGTWIYETTTGRVVWSQEYSDIDQEDEVSFSYIKLFADLENAVPRQLIE